MTNTCRMQRRKLKPLVTSHSAMCINYLVFQIRKEKPDPVTRRGGVSGVHEKLC